MALQLIDVERVARRCLDLRQHAATADSEESDSDALLYMKAIPPGRKGKLTAQQRSARKQWIGPTN